MQPAWAAGTAAMDMGSRAASAQDTLWLNAGASRTKTVGTQNNAGSDHDTNRSGLAGPISSLPLP